MSTAQRKGAAIELAAVASVFVIGVQSMRALSPQMSFLLRDRLHWPSEQIGALALLLFTAGFLPWVIGRGVGVERVWSLAAGAMAVSRLGLQLWQGDPLVDLVAHAVVAVAFFCFLPLTLARALPDPQRLRIWIVGFFTGQTLDLAIFGALCTYDLPWHEDFASALLTAALVALLLTTRRFETSDTAADLGSSRRAWAALGPYLFLWFQLSGNPGRHGAWIAGSHWGPWLAAVIGCLLLLALAIRGGSVTLPAAGASLVVTAGLTFWLGAPFPRPLPFAPPLASAVGAALIGTVALGTCWLWILSRLHPAPTKDRGDAFRMGRLAVAQGLACVALALLTFPYSASFDLPLPFDAAWLFPVAALWLGLGMGAAAKTSPMESGAVRLPGLAPALGLVLLVAAASSYRPAAPEALPGNWPIKMVSYNLHCAVGPAGAFELEAMARTLEKADADVIALQEISRGWSTIAGLDMAEWLSRRLDMPFVFYGTGDMTWGNALLSRLPFESHSGHALPSPGLLLKRGFIDAHLRLADGPPLRILATHFHHPDHGGSHRELQATALLEAWDGSPRTVILGDMNAKPASAEMAGLRAAGLIDSFADQEPESVLSFPSTVPIKRIDYIWHSPDLVHSGAVVSPSTASDHRLLTTVLAPR